MSFFSPSLHAGNVSRALRLSRECRIPASLLAPFGALRMAGAFAVPIASLRRILSGLRLSPHEHGL